MISITTECRGEKQTSNLKQMHPRNKSTFIRPALSKLRTNFETPTQWWVIFLWFLFCTVFFTTMGVAMSIIGEGGIPATIVIFFAALLALYGLWDMCYKKR
jgi:hypothetical protein